MSKTNSIDLDVDYSIIRRYEGQITCEEALRRIIEKHKHKSIQAAYDGGSHERH